jgi:hypothetical protein
VHRDALRADIELLARQYHTLVESPRVLATFARVTHDMCRRFHVDAVGIRGLCTYAGAGTQIRDDYQGHLFGRLQSPGGGLLVVPDAPPTLDGDQAHPSVVRVAAVGAAIDRRLWTGAAARLVTALRGAGRALSGGFGPRLACGQRVDVAGAMAPAGPRGPRGKASCFPLSSPCRWHLSAS